MDSSGKPLYYPDGPLAVRFNPATLLASQFDFPASRSPFQFPGNGERVFSAGQGG